MNKWVIERAPFQLGDRVRLKKSTLGIPADSVGIVVKPDIPVARAFEIGLDSIGIVEVEFDTGARLQTHWSNFDPSSPQEQEG